jgi:pimeloyl-ACP methyl ester carboxylesterase
MVTALPSRPWQAALATLRVVASEASAVARAACAMPLGLMHSEAHLDPAAPYPTPVVLVHGLFGDPTNFLALRRTLATRGIGNLASFSYGPRIDYQRFAPRLADLIVAVCGATGASRVDVVGHSLGGLVARYLVEIGHGERIRRLVTLGTPYVGHPNPPHELAIFAGFDPLVPAPTADGGARRRTLVVPDCGHLGLLYHPAVHRAVLTHLTRPSLRAAVAA